MLIVTWSVFALLSLIWTGGVWLAAELAQWTAGALRSGTGADISGWSIPDWVRLWVDPAWIQALQSALRWSLEAGASAVPYAETGLGWLLTLIWIVWGIGMVVLLAGALAVHMLIRRLRRARATHAR